MLLNPHCIVCGSTNNARAIRDNFALVAALCFFPKAIIIYVEKIPRNKEPDGAAVRSCVSRKLGPISACKEPIDAYANLNAWSRVSRREFSMPIKPLILLQ